MSKLDKPWYHPVFYAGKHTHFTRRMCIEQLCAHAVENYTTQLEQNRFTIFSRKEGNHSFVLSPEEHEFFETRILFYHQLRQKAYSEKIDPILLYHQVPEYRASRHALVLDDPETYHE